MNDDLIRITGISKEEMAKLWAAVQANGAKLRGCPGHRFQGPVLPAFSRQKPECKRCGGVMDMAAVLNYAAGYKAGGGSLVDLWPEFAVEHS